MVTKSHARAAAWTAAAILTVTAGLEVYWGLGGTWALHESTGEPPVSKSDHVGVVTYGLVTLAFAGLLLVRVGYWREHVPSAVARFAPIGAWVLAAMALVGAIQKFAAQDFVGGPINLIIALLAFVVARSEALASPTNRAAPTPGGKPGPPNPAH